MKKLSFLMLCYLFFASTNIVFGQFQDYKWGSYGLSFEIPSTHEIIDNSDVTFESGDDDTHLQMFPFKDASASPESMIKSVIKDLGTDVTILDQGAAYEVGGYRGYWITLKQSAYPEWEYWYIGFIDPTSSVNFYAIIWYKTGNSKAYKIAEDMSYKFKKI